MAAGQRRAERVLAHIEENGESRVVTLVDGGSLALMEQSSGPLTKVAYGSAYHGHKMLFEAEACAKALEVGADDVPAALDRLFSGSQQVPLLSDVMDRFDETGQRYAYMAWSGEGDVAYRPEAVA